MRIRAKWKFAAKATALGARVPQAGLFVPTRQVKVRVCPAGGCRKDPDLYKKSLN